MENNLRHVAIIMDGNRRWAVKRGLKPIQGHAQGIEALEKVVKEAIKQKITYLTIYALSTENLKNRNKHEIGSLFILLQKGFIEKLPVLAKAGVRVSFLGEIADLPLPVRKTLTETQRSLKSGKNLQLNVCINYGSRNEIIQTIKQTKNRQVTEEEFSNLLTQNIPDPELIIRTGGQQRLSNFLLWQAAYSELYFTTTLWPDFNEKKFREALKEYDKRQRNFGA